MSLLRQDVVATSFWRRNDVIIASCACWDCSDRLIHYNDVIMSAMASQITNLTIVYSSVYSGADRRKHQSSASLAFVRGIHRWPVNSPHKGPVTRKMFPFDHVKLLYYKHRDSNYKDDPAFRSLNVYNGNTYTWKEGKPRFDIQQTHGVLTTLWGRCFDVIMMLILRRLSAGILAKFIATLMDSESSWCQLNYQLVAQKVVIMTASVAISDDKIFIISRFSMHMIQPPISLTAHAYDAFIIHAECTLRLSLAFNDAPFLYSWHSMTICGVHGCRVVFFENHIICSRVTIRMTISPIWHTQIRVKWKPNNNWHFENFAHDDVMIWKHFLRY